MVTPRPGCLTPVRTFAALQCRFIAPHMNNMMHVAEWLSSVSVSVCVEHADHVNQVILSDSAVDLNAPKEMTAMPRKMKLGG